jgi:hypothetical protein
MALRSTDLCTEDQVAQRLGYANFAAVTDPATATRITESIEDACDLIAQYCDRDFSHNAAKTDLLAGYGTLELTVLQPPINNLVSVSFDGAALDPTTYECLGDDLRRGVIVLLAGAQWTSGLDDGGVGRNRVTDHERRRYSVVYDAGYYTPAQGVPVPNTYNVQPVPRPVARAAIMAAIWFFLNDGTDPTLTGEKLLSYGYTRDGKLLGDSGLPTQVEGILGGYRIVPVV